jgi:hypothetical protein
MALPVEEDQVVLDGAALADTLESSSLFRIQAIETETPIEPRLGVMTSTAPRISLHIPDLDERRLFAATCLSSRSCQVIAVHVEANAAEVGALLAESEVGERDDSSTCCSAASLKCERSNRAPLFWLIPESCPPRGSTESTCAPSPTGSQSGTRKG